MGVVSKRGAFGLLAALLVVLLGIALAIGTGRGERVEVAAQQPAPEVVPAARGEWVGTWSASPSGAEPGTRDGLGGQTIRNVVRTSVGGSGVRVELSNRYGSRPVTFTHVTVALPSALGGPTAHEGTMHRVTFGDGTAVTIPAGGSVLSDAVPLDLPPAADLLVSLYTPDATGPVTYHRMAQQPNYLARGDQSSQLSGAGFTHAGDVWRYLTGVQVFTSASDGAVVALGDSLTDGITSTPGANRRWTDFLAARLREEPDAPHMAVLNQGISGNRLLRDGAPDRLFNGASGLSRLHSDVLHQPGVSAVVVQLGVNDLLLEPRASDARLIVHGLNQLAEESRAEGLRVLGATLAPFGGHRGWTPELEQLRQQVNEQIRTAGIFDAVVDFDAALHDPAAPHLMLAAFDSGDGLHPNDHGFQAMAQAVDLTTLADHDTSAQAL
ncbi:SGNH/GDSL hydrolase family protein [Streptomyces sp. DSM 44915]|uniref:SGNH/GDSL hydrolase family protein n=1 Tax=Streptomyces chisholmiae TaxID=3075540 RepID=A0ABU2JT43_9ACTN|nr:SGNH/GDSL hydrolase family protein [Streptomyces sp. DSM 44915]MDT0267898.1 SGNH/GDSL hydrolase family protein [Streptomyces sp. DSM 44915]